MSKDTNRDDQDVVDYIETSLRKIATLEKREESLSKENADLKKVVATLEGEVKQASEKPSDVEVFDRSAVQENLNLLEQSGIIKSGSASQIEDRLFEDPNTVFDFIAALTSASSDGQAADGYEKFASKRVSDDPNNLWRKAVQK